MNKVEKAMEKLPTRRGGGRAKGYFPKVKEARQALADHAVELYLAYRELAVAAMKAEKFEVAEAIMWKLISHMPEDAEVGTLLDSAVDNPKPIEAGGTPTIQIGLALGGMPPQNTLPEPPKVIEIKNGPPKGTSRNNQV